MKSISEYRTLIKETSAVKQSFKIKRKTWGRFLYTDKQRIENQIFGNSDEVELSREDIFSENDAAKKIVMVLMWGYPNGGRGNNINNVLKEIDELSRVLSQIKNMDLSRKDADAVLKMFDNIKGLGISTGTKLLYFFNVSICSKKCLIFDRRVNDALNSRQFIEFGNPTWVRDANHYYQYIELLDNLSKSMDVPSEQIELFLFTYAKESL